MEEIKELEILRELLEAKQYTRLRQRMADMNIADIAAVNRMLDAVAEETMGNDKVKCIKYIYFCRNGYFVCKFFGGFRRKIFAKSIRK